MKPGRLVFRRLSEIRLGMRSVWQFGIDGSREICLHEGMRKQPSGQVGLLLLVVLGLVISVVLSIAARSLSDVVLSRQERENNAAFSVAESGVEAALLRINESGEEASGQVAIADSTGLVTGQYRVNLESFDLYLKAGDLGEIDVSGALSTVTVKWTRENNAGEDVACSGEGANNAPAALEVIVVKSDETVDREYYNASGCSLGNGFAESQMGSDGFVSQVTLSLPANALLLRVRPLYTGATVQVSGDGLSTQMYLVQAEAQGGDADKEIEVKRSRDAAGSIFDYALFSGETIVK